MSEDVPWLYHQNTDLMYLTGCAEPGSALLLEKVAPSDAAAGDAEAQTGRAVLFVQPRNAEKEVWDGPMLGAGEETRAHFGVDCTMSLLELPQFLGQRLEGAGGQPFRRFFLDPVVNAEVSSLVGQVAGGDGELRARLLSLWEQRRRPKDFVCRPRLVKSEAEVELLRKACSAISGGLNDAMAHCVMDSFMPNEIVAADASRHRSGLVGVRERIIEAHIEFGAKMRGASRMSFPSVVASGENGTILHYMDNSATAVSGDFVMVDAGCQVHGACSDVSRSWPVSGSFTGPQRDLYDLVLDVQLRCIDMVREGGTYHGRKVSMNSVHSYASKALIEGLLYLGFMEGMTVEEALARGAYRRWFPHSIGHYLGYDVHDTHSLSKDLPLVAGMCVTIEPGLYIRGDDLSAPADFRGIGMRIEDDLLVMPGGEAAEVLSHEAIKDPDEIEALVGSGDSSAAGGLFARPEGVVPVPAVQI